MQNPRPSVKAEPDQSPLIRFSRKNALWLFLIAAAGLIFTSFLTHQMQQILPRQTQLRDLATNLMFYLPFCALGVYVSIRRKPMAAMSLRPNPLGLGATFYITVLAVLCVFFVSDLSLVWSIPLQKLGLDVFKARMDIPADPAMLVLSVFTTAAIPAVCEELVFRGVVLSGLENDGTRYAARMSALLFALLHGSLTGLPGLYVLGLIMAQLVISADSIYAGITFHTVYNAAVIVIRFLQRDMPPEIACPENILESLGGTGGLLSLIVEIVVIGWMLRFSLNVFYMGGRMKGVQMLSDKKPRFSWDEKILMIAGLALAAVLFAGDVRFMMM